MKPCLKVLGALAVSALFVLSAGTAFAQTPDGEPPSVEEVCDGQVGAAFGLCNAYCEAMDCDSEEPQASEQACMMVAGQYEQITGGTMPCEMMSGPMCGNGVVEPPEECDDGGNEDGDGCSSECLIEIID